MLFNIYLLNVVSIMFPTLIYMIFFSFKEHYTKGESESALDFTLVISLFITYSFYNIINKDINLFSFTIPILISFVFNKFKTSIVISMVSLFIIYELGYFNFLFIILYLIYYIVYYIFNKKNISKLYLCGLFSSVTLIFMYFYYGFDIKCLYASLIYFICVLSIYFLINKSNSVINLYNSLKDIEKNNILKTTIFKVTHEIKNPLAVMKGYLNMFDINNKEKCIKYIGILKVEVENALMVLQDFSLINNLSINKDHFDFNELLYEIKETVFPFFNDKNICYSFKSEDSIIINADYNRLKQVFINLIKNSIEASNMYGKIIVSSYISGNKLLLSIKDNGCGMDKDTLDNIFTPFYTKKKYGTGLGLCLSKEIIEGHGGSIKYISYPNKGTTIRIILPL